MPSNKSVVRSQSELAEDHGQSDGDDQLAPAVPQGEKSTDTPRESEGDQSETDRVIQRAAPEKPGLGYTPGQFGEVTSPVPLLLFFLCRRVHRKRHGMGHGAQYPDHSPAAEWRSPP